jgi:hypothetical protein
MGNGAMNNRGGNQQNNQDMQKRREESNFSNPSETQTRKPAYSYRQEKKIQRHGHHFQTAHCLPSDQMPSKIS